MMRRRSDVFGTLAWGLRTYAWVVVLFTVTLGFVVPLLLQQVPQQYEASAQAGPAGKVRIPNLDALPKVASSAFSNVYNSDEVKIAAGLEPTDQLGADEIELVAGQDNVVMSVIGRAPTADAAANLANTAAAVFVDEMNKYTEAIGPFALATLAEEPQPKTRLTGAKTWALGLFAGLTAGVGTVALLLVLRRPVIDAVSAEESAGAPVLGRMTLGGGRATAGMAPLCRRILAESTQLLLLVGPPNTGRDRYLIAEEIITWLGRVRRVVPLRTRARDEEFGSASLTARESGTSPGGEDLLVIDDASPVEVATRPDRSLTLLVVREGISQSSMREYADQHLDGDDTAILLVARPSRWRFLAGGSRRSTRKSTGGGTAVGTDALDRRSRPDGREDAPSHTELD